MAGMTPAGGGVGGNERDFHGRDGKPLIGAENVALFGFDPFDAWEIPWKYLHQNGLKGFSAVDVQREPVQAASNVLEWLAETSNVVFMHFDVKKYVLD